MGYQFKEQQLLRAALYHSSYANEHRTMGISSNERLEFLGDAVLGFVSADFLYRKHPDLPEGELTRIRAALVCEESLHEVAQSLRLGEFLLLGKGEEQGGGRCRPSILADATESVFAAVYLDGGMDAASDLIHRVLLDKEREEVVEERRRDYKTELQERVPTGKLAGLIEVLRQDPRRAGSKHEPNRVYQLAYAGLDVAFRVDGSDLRVVGVNSG